MKQPETKEQKFLIDCIITDLVSLLVRDHNMTVNEALSTIFASDYYEQLNNLDTELYLRSSLNNYHYLLHELKFGKTA